jgi:hypothetical protein
MSRTVYSVSRGFHNTKARKSTDFQTLCSTGSTSVLYTYYQISNVRCVSCTCRFNVTCYLPLPISSIKYQGLLLTLHTESITNALCYDTAYISAGVDFSWHQRVIGFGIIGAQN